MRLKAQLSGIVRDLRTGLFNISFTTTEGDFKEFENLEKVDLELNLKKWSDPRSGRANRFFHELVGQLADAMTISKTAAKNYVVCRYGQKLLIDEDAGVLVYKTKAPPDYIAEVEDPHMKLVSCEEVDGKYWYTYEVYRGVRTYSKYEFSKLIDGLVAECKDYDIPTDTPAEIARIKALWKGETNG